MAANPYLDSTAADSNNWGLNYHHATAVSPV